MESETFNYPKAQAIDENLLCPICSDPCVEPVVEPGCGQMFCKDCLTEWLNRQNTCPHCRCKQDARALAQPPRFITNALNALLVICPTCEGHLERKDLCNHVSKCPVECKLGCGEKVTPVDLEAHEETNCQAKIIPCPAADVGCQYAGPRGSLSQHTLACSVLHQRGLLLRLRSLEARSEEINTLREKVQTLEVENHKQKEKIERLCQVLENGGGPNCIRCGVPMHKRHESSSSGEYCQTNDDEQERLKLETLRQEQEEKARWKAEEEREKLRQFQEEERKKLRILQEEQERMRQLEEEEKKRSERIAKRREEEERAKVEAHMREREKKNEAVRRQQEEERRCLEAQREEARRKRQEMKEKAWREELERQEIEKSRSRREPEEQ